MVIKKIKNCLKALILSACILLIFDSIIA